MQGGLAAAAARDLGKRAPRRILAIRPPPCEGRRGAGATGGAGVAEFFQALGTIGLVLLIGVGALAGLLASGITGRDHARNVAIGIVGAVLLPFALALVGVGVLAAGGLIAILVAAAIGAVAVLAIAKALFD
jgi:uncharacterized membrane protein YeaQ/YmgE (transglycosylase-associated protein family)